jgi:hypothetical protein
VRPETKVPDGGRDLPSSRKGGRRLFHGPSPLPCLMPTTPLHRRILLVGRWSLLCSLLPCALYAVFVGALLIWRGWVGSLVLVHPCASVCMCWDGGGLLGACKPPSFCVRAALRCPLALCGGVVRTAVPMLPSYCLPLCYVCAVDGGGGIGKRPWSCLCVCSGHVGVVVSVPFSGWFFFRCWVAVASSTPTQQGTDPLGVPPPPPPAPSIFP